MAVSFGAFLFVVSEEQISGVGISLVATPIGIGGALVVADTTPGSCWLAPQADFSPNASQIGSEVKLTLIGVILAGLTTLRRGS